MSEREFLGGWIRPPRLQISSDGERADDERSATWLELFFDLVFVVAIAELAHVLGDDFSTAGVLTYAVLFVPVWWAWVGSTFYATRFDTDDLGHRLLAIVEMFAVVDSWRRSPSRSTPASRARRKGSPSDTPPSARC